MSQDADGDLSAHDCVEAARRWNMRQLLLRAARLVNRDVVAALNTRGHGGLRATHTILLSHMALAGGSITQVAERAGITKQAMGRIAADLEAAGYVRILADPADRRARKIELTAAGQTLMADSFEVMAELEERYGTVIGPERLGALLGGLRAFTAAFDPP